MKKIGMLMILLVVILVTGKIIISKGVSSRPIEKDTKETTVKDTEVFNSNTASLGEKETTAKINETKKTTDKKKKVTMENALFIGDSRTVGLYEYGKMKGPDFFCNVGMSIYNLNSQKVSVPGVGKLTLDTLLKKKNYSAVYIMLGINELGYNIDKTIAKYSGLIDNIKKLQPNAYIFIEANLHVGQKRSDTDEVYNNKNINNFNNRISKLADNDIIFYIDVNPLFDDAYGCLDSEKASDDTHPYGRYYEEWGNWIVKKTLSLI